MKKTGCIAWQRRLDVNVLQRTAPDAGRRYLPWAVRVELAVHLCMLRQTRQLIQANIQLRANRAALMSRFRANLFQGKVERRSKDQS